MTTSDESTSSHAYRLLLKSFESRSSPCKTINELINGTFYRHFIASREQLNIELLGELRQRWLT